MKQINCWVSDELAAEIEKAAAEEDRSVSSWIRRLVSAHLIVTTQAAALAAASVDGETA